MTRSIPAIEGLEARVLLSGSPIIVDTFNDVVDANDGYTSLREAISQAAADTGDDVIQLPTGWYGLNEQLTIDDTSGSLSIVGSNGLAVLDAQGNGRVMEIAAGSNVLLTQLGITGGYTSEDGGGIYNQGTLTLDACSVYDNQAYYNGGGIATAYGTLNVNNTSFTNNSAIFDYGNCGGALFVHQSELNVIDSIMTNNSANTGGGINADNSSVILTNTTITGNTVTWSGGGIWSDNSILYITDSTLSDNTADAWGGAILIQDYGTLYLTNSTVSGNTATNGGGGAMWAELSSAMIVTGSTIAGNTGYDVGGGINVYDSSLILTNSTIAENSTHAMGDGFGGGVYISFGATATITNATIAGNTTEGQGGGVYNDGTLYLDNTILADNTAEIDAPDFGDWGTTTSRLVGGASNNLIGSGEGHSIRNGDNGNIVGQSARLELLNDNGGATLTISPTASSPAINHGNDAAATDAGLLYDQRGEDYARYTGGVDIGALEYQGTLLGNINITLGQGQDIHVADFGTALPSNQENGAQTYAEQVTKHFTIRNEGPADLILSDLQLPGEDFVFSWVDQANEGLTEWTIAPGETLEFTITFQPSDVGEYNDTLTFATNDPFAPTYEVALMGEGVETLAVYEVWGGNSDYRYESMGLTGHDIAQRGDYFLLGTSSDEYNSTYFAGDFEYYVVVTRAQVQLDAVMGSTGEYGYGDGAGNIYDSANFYGAPDEYYAIVGFNGNATKDPFNGFVFIPNLGDWEGVALYTGAFSLPMQAGIEQEVSQTQSGDISEIEHSVWVEDRGWSTSVRFQAPSGQWYDMWLEYDESDDRYSWEYYNNNFQDISSLVDVFGDGWYTIEASGSPFGTKTEQIWFGSDDGENPLAWPTQIPEITNISANQSDVPVTTTIEWSPVTDPYVTTISGNIENADNTFCEDFWFESDETSYTPAGLSAVSNYDVDLNFNHFYDTFTTDGFQYSVSRSLNTRSLFRTEGGAAVQPDLAVEDVFYAPGEYQVGDTIDMDYLLGNLGEGNAVAVNLDNEAVLYHYEIRLSQDAIWGNGDDIVLHRDGDLGWLGGEIEDTREELAPHDAMSAGQMTIPSDIAAGSYYMMVGLDVDSQIAETDETNNVWYSAEADILVGEALPQPEIDVEYNSQDNVHDISLGRIDLGTTTSSWFTIRNEGDAPLVLNMTRSGDEEIAFTCILGDPCVQTITLAAGESLQIQVQYNPSNQGTDAATLTIYSNDSNESIYELTVTGQAILPQGEGYYEVWGGNTDYRSDSDDNWGQPYYNIDQQDYVYLGGSLDVWSDTEFFGSSDYDYYVIATRARVQIDSVEGGDSQYGYSIGDGNTYDWENVSGAPDESCATVGYQGNHDSFCGFMILENPGSWDGLTVYAGDIDLPLRVSIEESAVTNGTGQADTYEYGIDVYDQGWSTSVRFQAPSGQWYDLWWDDTDGDHSWEYWDESFTSVEDLVSEFGDGWYTVESSGSPFGTTTTQIWFGNDDGETPLAWPTQVPETTSITPGQTDVSTDASLDWLPVTDPNITNIYSDIEDVDGNDWGRFWSNEDATSFGPAELAPATDYAWYLDFENSHDGLTSSGHGYNVMRSVDTTIVFRTEGEPSDVDANLVMGEVFYTPGMYRPGDVINMDFLLGNLGDGNAVVVGEDGYALPYYSEIRLSMDTIWGNNDDVVIYRRADAYWLGQEAEDTRNETSPPETWPGGVPIIPLDILRGNYYVLAGIDVENQVAESNEGDNIWISDTPNISVETRTDTTTPAVHVLSVGVANPAVKFRGDAAAQRVHNAFEGMDGLVSNILVRYNIDSVGNQEHFLDTLAWFESRVLPGDQFIIYIASQACYDLEGNEIAVDAQYNTAKGNWSLTQTTTGDEYLYLSSVDGESNWLSDDKLAASFFTYSWAAADKLFIIDTPFSGGFIGRENPEDPSQWDLSLLRYDPQEVLDDYQTTRRQLATGSLEIIAAADEGQFAFMTPEKAVSWAGVNRMGTHMVSAILAQRNPGHAFDATQLFWQTQEANSLYYNDAGMYFFYANGSPFENEDDGYIGSGGTIIDLYSGNIHVQLGADVKAVRYIDADGSLVTLQLNRGIADLTFLGEDLQQTFASGIITVRATGGATLGSIQLIDTTANDSLTISVRGGDGYADLGDVNGAGSLGYFNASRVDLIGEGIQLEEGGVIHVTHLHNILNGADVFMSGEGPAKGVQFTAARVGAGSDLQFAGAIYSLSLTSWDDGSLKASYIQQLRVRKNMGADVTCTGTNSLGQSIVGAYIYGNVTGGEWSLAGAVRNWYVRGSAYDVNMHLNATILSFYVGGNLIGSDIQFNSAKTLRIVGRVDDSRFTTMGNINALLVGAMRNSTVFAGVRSEYNIDNNEDGVFDLPSQDDLGYGEGRIANFQVRGMRGVANAFENSNLAANSFGKVVLKMSTLENPVGLSGASQQFGLATTDGVDQLTLVLNKKKYSWKNHSWTRDLNPLDLTVADLV